MCNSEPLNGRRRFGAVFRRGAQAPGKIRALSHRTAHAGSLLAAVGSYLDARANGARWLVRIEDLDTPRVVPGCADQMLRTLEAFGFEWDGDVIYQSTRRAAYDEALATLAARETHISLQLFAQGSRRQRSGRTAWLSRHVPAGPDAAPARPRCASA